LASWTTRGSRFGSMSIVRVRRVLVFLVAVFFLRSTCFEIEIVSWAKSTSPAVSAASSDRRAKVREDRDLEPVAHLVESDAEPSREALVAAKGRRATLLVVDVRTRRQSPQRR
jgi:hypothetical protein